MNAQIVRHGEVILKPIDKLPTEAKLLQETYNKIGEQILNWHTQSIKNLLEKEVEREKGLVVEISICSIHKEIDAHCNICNVSKMWNKAKQETVLHLQQVIKSLEDNT